MSNFAKDHPKARQVYILVFFVVGLFCVIFGWTFTGEMKGLVIMLVGTVLLLASLFVYNSAFKDRKVK